MQLSCCHRVWFGSAIFFLVGGSAVDAADEGALRRTVSVSGRGKVSAPPSVASILAGVATQGASAREALSANNRTMASLQEILKGNEVAARDLQTIQVSVQPQYEPISQPGRPQRVTGYEVNNQVRITVRDLAKLGGLLDAIVGAGSNQIYGVNFRTEGSETLLDTARRAAMADARRKAELLAGEAGLTLGTAISIRDDIGAYPYSPVQSAGPIAAAASPVPISVGEQELSAYVQVVYELKAPK